MLIIVYTTKVLFPRPGAKTSQKATIDLITANQSYSCLVKCDVTALITMVILTIFLIWRTLLQPSPDSNCEGTLRWSKSYTARSILCLNVPNVGYCFMFLFCTCLQHSLPKASLMYLFCRSRIRPASFVKGQGHQGIFTLVSRVPYKVIVQFYWSISKAPRQGGIETIAFVASMKCQACWMMPCVTPNASTAFLQVKTLDTIGNC